MKQVDDRNIHKDIEKMQHEEIDRLRTAFAAKDAEIERLWNALVDIQYYCTHVERSSVDGAMEIARKALDNAAPAQKSESEVIEIDAAGRVNRQIAEALASRNADVERLEAIIEKWKTSIPVEDKSGDPVDDPERVGAFVAKQFDKLEMLEKRGWTCANCGAEHAYDHAGIIMQRENGIVHYCCGCEGAVKTLEEARAYAATLRLALVESMITPEALLIAGKPDCIAQEVWDQIVRSVEIARAALGIA